MHHAWWHTIIMLSDATNMRRKDVKIQTKKVNLGHSWKKRFRRHSVQSVPALGFRTHFTRSVERSCFCSVARRDVDMNSRKPGENLRVLPGDRSKSFEEMISTSKIQREIILQKGSAVATGQKKQVRCLDCLDMCHIHIAKTWKSEGGVHQTTSASSAVSRRISGPHLAAWQCTALFYVKVLRSLLVPMGFPVRFPCFCRFLCMFSICREGVWSHHNHHNAAKVSRIDVRKQSSGLWMLQSNSMFSSRSHL